MRLRVGLISGCLFLLSGCGHIPFHSKTHTYLNESGVIPKTRSASTAQLKNATQFYPVPAVANMQLAKIMPSIIPPGSNLQRFAKAKKETAANMASLQTQNGKTVVAVSENVNVAWKEVPVVLSNTPYHVLDQDRSLSSYFVLDTLQTKQQITEKTPIYRLLLQPKGTNTVIQIVSRDNKPVPTAVRKRILSSLASSWHN